MDDEIQISVSLPLDSDGFLRRECPHCMGQFKWHNGPANEEAEGHAPPPAYYCPRCGQPAGPDSWFTPAQMEYIEGAAAPTIASIIDDELGGLFKGMSSKHVKVTQTGHLDVPEPPDPLSEPDDMMIVASPCHGYEPVKVSENHTGPLYCLICGSAFAV